MVAPRMGDEDDSYTVMMTLEDVDTLESLQAHPGWRLWEKRLEERNEYVANMALEKGETEFEKGLAAGHVESIRLLRELIQEAKGT